MRQKELILKSGMRLLECFENTLGTKNVTFLNPKNVTPLIKVKLPLWGLRMHTELC